MAKKRGLKQNLTYMFYNQPSLNRKVVSLKDSIDEVAKVLNFNKKNTK